MSFQPRFERNYDLLVNAGLKEGEAVPIALLATDDWARQRLAEFGKEKADDRRER